MRLQRLDSVQDESFRFRSRDAASALALFFFADQRRNTGGRVYGVVVDEGRFAILLLNGSFV